jgi:hypothetical protein
MSQVVLRSLDKFEFSQRIDSELGWDNITESCRTDFKDILVITIAKEIHEITDKDGWKLKYWEKNKEDKIFNGFMENGEVRVLLAKKADKGKYEYRKVIVKFDFPDDEKKEIAKLYLENVIESLYYLYTCIFLELDEVDLDGESIKVNLDEVIKYLSKEVYGLLTPDEIKKEFESSIQRAIDKINDETDFDYSDSCYDFEHC